jgi:peptidoglycan/LPS O-acetylase OafA/YrhL
MKYLSIFHRAIVPLENTNADQEFVHSYRSELDGLRGIAVLAVIFYHAKFPFCKGGYVGVDVFFVLSGYLMISIIAREMSDNTFSILKFYERRVRRILPMLYFTIICCYIYAYMFLVDLEFLKFTKSAFMASIGLSNFFFANTTNGYFDTNIEFLPLIHTWTLGVEEQFYVIIPLIFIIFWRFSHKLVLIVLGCLALASFYLTLTALNGNYKFYMLHTRFWELAIGSLIVFLPKQTPTNIGSSIGFFSIMIPIIVFNESTPDPSVFTLLPTVGTAFIIVFTNSETVAGKIFSHRSIASIGLISYSAYLIHQPLFAFARLLSFKPLNPLVFVILTVITLVLSFITWKLVENPFRDKTLISISQIMFLILGFFIVTRPDSLLALSKRSIIKKIDIGMNFNLNPVKKPEQNYPLNSSNSTETFYNVLPSQYLFDVGFGEFRLCLHSWGALPIDQPFRRCPIGINEQSSPVYILTGDSMGMSFTPVLDKLEFTGLYVGFPGCDCDPFLSADGTDEHVGPNGGLICFIFI